MKKNIFIFVLFLFAAEFLFASDITVIVTGVKANQGRVYVGLYDNPDEFPSGRQKAGQFVDSDAQRIRLVFTDLVNRKYAFAAFQDKNANEKLDTNFIGIPKERYGVSGRQVLGSPDFSDAAVLIQSDNQQVEINIE